MQKNYSLIQNDSWLEPYYEEIEKLDRLYLDKLREIKSQHNSLIEFSNWHLLYGIHHLKESKTVTITEWAPAAKSISLVGEFNQWDDSQHALKKQPNGNWSLRLPQTSLPEKSLYKLKIKGADNSVLDRLPSATRRIIQNKDTHDFSAQIWGAQYQWKNQFDTTDLKHPLIYEAHIGMAGEDERMHTYTEFTKNILPRIKKLGYNTIQLMAIQEHPYYGSFGYHVSNFFAASSKFGTPEELKKLIDSAHGMGIAVLLDIVHSHSVKNTAEGLNNFDGSGHQYFKAGSDGEHPQWDSKCFDYHKTEVQKFLLSNVRYWLEEFRFDGFRFDGITSMLYHHHGSTSFDHYDKYFKEGIDHSAITYLKLATTLAKQINPNVMLIAEDMSGMPGLCTPVEDGGIGFTHRLAMGIPDFWIKLLKHKQDEQWNMHELWSTLSNRRYGEANIAYAESHDQALVGDKTLAFWLMDAEMYWSMAKDKRNLTIDRGLALHKMIRLLTATAGGEGYLNFIGNEFGHPEWVDFPREGNQWSFNHCRRQWSLVDNSLLCYEYLNNFDASMIHFLRNFSPMGDFGNSQERWLNDEDKILAFSKGEYLFVFNFHPENSYTDYQIPTPQFCDYKLQLHTDNTEFGGFNRLKTNSTYPTTPWQDAQGQVIHCYIPARTALIFSPL